MEGGYAEIGIVALRIVEGSGPFGFYVGAGLVGLTLMVIVLARFAGIFDNVRSEKQKTDFLDRVLKQYERLAVIETDLREDVERIEVEKEELRQRLIEALATMDLMRVQLRRFIELLTAVKEGRMKPTDLPADIAQAVQ